MNQEDILVLTKAHNGDLLISWHESVDAAVSYHKGGRKIVGALKLDADSHKGQFLAQIAPRLVEEPQYILTSSHVQFDV